MQSPPPRVGYSRGCMRYGQAIKITLHEIIQPPRNPRRFGLCHFVAGGLNARAVLEGESHRCGGRNGSVPWPWGPRQRSAFHCKPQVQRNGVEAKGRPPWGRRPPQHAAGARDLTTRPSCWPQPGKGWPGAARLPLWPCPVPLQPWQVGLASLLESLSPSNQSWISDVNICHCDYEFVPCFVANAT